MTYLKFLIVLLIGSCFFQSCGKSEDAGQDGSNVFESETLPREEAVPEEIPQPKAIAPQDPRFSVGLKAHQLPNQYSAQLTWEIPDSDVLWVLERQEAGEVRGVLSRIRSSMKSFEDYGLKPNRTYQYFLRKEDTSSQSTEWNVELTVPQDEIYEGVTHLDSDRIVDPTGRIFLLDGAQIILHGWQFDLRGRELISQNATIHALDDSEYVARPGQNAMQVKAILLTPKKATGHLTINVQGQHGGRGLPATSSQQAGKGGDGGQSAPLQIAIAEPSGFSFSVEGGPGLGGMGGSPDSASPGTKGRDGVSTAQCFIFSGKKSGRCP